MLKRQENADRAQWVHTAQQMSLLYNINRGQKGKVLTWEDFNPYEIERVQRVKPTELNSVNLARFNRMTNTLNNGKKNSST